MRNMSQGVSKLNIRKIKGVILMKQSKFLVGVLALCFMPVSSLVMASDVRYGCCLIKTEDKAADIWEYEDEVPFTDCYRSAQLIGNPFEFLRDRKYEFHTGKRCLLLRDQHELIPVLWSFEYRNG